MFEAWNTIKTRTEAIANEHILAAKEMFKASDRMLDLLQKQKAKRQVVSLLLYSYTYMSLN